MILPPYQGVRPDEPPRRSQSELVIQGVWMAGDMHEPAVYNLHMVIYSLAILYTMRQSCRTFLGSL